MESFDKILAQATRVVGESATWTNIKPYVIALVILVVGFLIARTLSKAIDRVMRQRGSPHGAVVTAKLVFYAILTLAVFGALTQLGVKLTGLLTAAGIFTVALGFAAQTSVSNVISGLFLLIDRPFSIDDTVKIEQTLGTIISIDLLSTKVRTFDNLVVRIPNETLLKSTITNYTLYEVRRIEIPVQVAYDTDLRGAQRVLQDVMREHKAVLDEPQPVVLTDLLAESGINLLIRAWVIRTDFVTARSELTTAVREALAEAKIEIPFPQRVLHLKKNGSAAELVAEQPEDASAALEKTAAQAPSDATS